jgi:hypothetical protein
MLINCCSILHDEPIKVVVGPEKIPFRVSPLLLAEQSDPLNAMVSNGMKESQEKVSYLPEEEPEVFQYFLDWGLSGAYRVLQTGVKGRGEYSVNDMCQVEECTTLQNSWSTWELDALLLQDMQGISLHAS